VDSAGVSPIIFEKIQVTVTHSTSVATTRMSVRNFKTDCFVGKFSALVDAEGSGSVVRANANCSH